MKKIQRLPAFSLVEIAIGLFIVGLLLTAVMKGARLIDTAKLQTCAQQIIKIKQDFNGWLEEQQNDTPLIENFLLTEKLPKLGGKFIIEQQGSHYFLTLADKTGQGLLSPAQIKELMKYFPEATYTGCQLNGTAKTCKISVPLV